MNIKKNKTGFTLLEVLAALVVVALAVLALITLHLHSLRAYERSIRQQQALLICQNQLERLGQNETDDKMYSGVETENEIEYHWLTQSGRSPAAVKGLREVRVQTSWPDETGSQKIALATWIPRQDP